MNRGFGYMATGTCGISSLLSRTQRTTAVLHVRSFQKGSSSLQ
jgi:hypothetical protein